MHQHPDYTRERIAVLARRVQAAIHPQRRAAESIEVSPPVGRISYAAAQELEYRPASLGEQLGPAWSTYWFRVRARIPEGWAGHRVDLLWSSHGEALLWRNGRAVQGFNQGLQLRPNGDVDVDARCDAMLTRNARGGEELELQVEMACNRALGEAGSPQELQSKPYATVEPYVLDQCELALFDEAAWDLYFDLEVLRQLEAEQLQDLDPAWGGALLRGLNDVANLLDLGDRETWPKARAILRSLLGKGNGSALHQVSALGHAHLDTAWLWPTEETERKCERTFSSQLAYMEDYPEYKFACSQAQHYEWVRQRNPELYERIRNKVADGQFVPVGGTWTEPDTNIPSGEALLRQFLVGQRFFERELGVRCGEMWEPDVFGCNAQLPQMMRLSGIRWFLTQKLSWSRFTQPRHQTFTWRGLDGSEVLAHFPPADAYNCVPTVPLLRQSVRAYRDHDRSGHSLLLYGFGDGGGGPNRAMLETLRRVRDLRGVPETVCRSSAEFFTELEADCTDRPVFVGEMYLEYHRGTYTSQAAIKRGNRKCELALHDAELMASLAAEHAGQPYPHATLEQLWKMQLLHQFHDILPGTSIREVVEHAERDYAAILERCDEIAGQAGARLLGDGGVPVPFNTLGFARTRVERGPDGELAHLELPSCGIGAIAASSDAVRVTDRSSGGATLENAQLRVRVASDGTLQSVLDKATGREALAEAGNRWLIYDDEPVAFDAWDCDPFHLETERPCPAAQLVRIDDDSPLRVDVVFERQLGKASRAEHRVRLEAGSRRVEFHAEVDWHEEHKMLKVAFPVDVHSMRATYEVQFGAVERPTHFNTAQDFARYEVPAQKWSDLSEHDFGVALLSESKYGYSTHGNVLRLSLLRSPKWPDAQADMGLHRFAYALMPHAGSWQSAGVVAEALDFNHPVRWLRGHAEPRSYAAVDDSNLVLDTIKRAEDSEATVVRLYEAHGARGKARLRWERPIHRAAFCNALEEELERAPVDDGTVEITYTPFQIITLKLVGAADAP